MDNGIIYGLDAAQYFAQTDRLNNSGIKKLLQSPAHYKAQEQSEQTKAMLIGSAVHCAVLEPLEFRNRYFVGSIDGRTKEGKERKKEIDELGQAILSEQDGEMIFSIRDSVRSNPTAAKILASGNAEVTIFTDVDNVPAKCRIDWLRSNIITDLKTTDNASAASFQKTVINYGYDVQAAWYLDCAKAAGLSISSFIFIAVEKSPPYAVAIYELESDAIELGRQKYKKALSIYKHCLATGEWPGYPTDIQIITLPTWAYNE